MAQEQWGIWRGGFVSGQLRGNKTNAWALYQNDVFIVTLVPLLCDWGDCVHMVMRLKPEATPLSGLTWAAKQRIKNELVGQERLAIEVFPPVGELVDQADAYHLWVLPEGFKLPFGVEETIET